MDNYNTENSAQILVEEDVVVVNSKIGLDVDTFWDEMLEFLRYNENLLIRFSLIPEEDVIGTFELFETDTDGTIYRISLDPRGSILIALIHEVLHIFFPNEDEEYIEELTTRVVESIGFKQYRQLLSLLSGHIGRK